MAAKTYRIFTSAGMNSLEISPDMLVVNTTKAHRIKPTYVQSVEQTGDLGLDKKAVKLCFYDLFGNLESVEFGMHGADVLALKKALGK
ncbi:MAG: hypothetical protein Q8P02_04875 [Candidatus Micrarchaeota archaeon]|nr:hypothetical protein [Candidatus Micrarchaeota archaeon]